ncbi:copper chaperone PCu(A)C [Pseudotabrizicola sp.]|uniref:copper chaperone PCu(A)C n=1 Tax=Pseudotabrizicola sp. TaxID=2939647 RepID=UPI00271C00FF|nr:copper chaperone PCu(A)C [Pseudotabrizicola sp.]MDO8881661.1 copper chaperone PCu(A)C [Pseudotabrizicola sp.]
MQIASVFRSVLSFQSLQKPLVALCAAMMLATPAQAQAHGVTAGDLEIIHPHILAPRASAKSAGGFMGIANEGTTDDRLIGIEVPSVKHSELHTTIHSADGIAKMMHVDAIDIPAGETVLLERGGMHIMFMGLTEPMIEGQMVPATLIFEHAGRVEVEFSVDPSTGADHSAMGH